MHEGNGSGTIRALLVDDQSLVREVLASLITSEGDIEVIGAAASLNEASRDATLLKPDVVILQLGLQGSQGAEACASLTRWLPDIRILALSRATDEGTMVSTFRAGARGYALMDSEPGCLRIAVRTVATGGTFIDPKVAHKLVSIVVQGTQPRGPHDLTPREMRVLRLLPRGLTNREIGAQLGVSSETVKTHVRSILKKLEVSDRVRAAGIAIREGLA